MQQTIEKNLWEVRERIATASSRAGRKPEDVTLVAVTKYAEPGWVRALATMHTVFGEADHNN